MGMGAQAFVQFLTVSALFHGFHHDVLGCHKGQLFHHTAAYHFVVHHKARADIDINIQDRIHGKEGFRYRDALIGRVVERALKPLGCSGKRGIQRIRNDIPCKRGNPLGAHRVALIRHRRGADLMLFKGFFHLLKGLENPQVVCEFIGALRKSGKYGKEVSVRFAGIGLAGNRHTAREAHFLCNQCLQLFHLFLVALKEFHKAGLRAGRTLGAEQQQFGKPVFQFLDIRNQFIDPQRGTFADSGQLCRLQMRIGQTRQVAVLFCKIRKVFHNLRGFFQDNAGSLPQDDHIRIIADIAGGCTQMDNCLRFRALLAVRINMRHHVVAHFALAGFRNFVIDVVAVRFQFRNLLLGDIQTQRTLRLCQRDPQTAPGAEFEVIGKHRLHFVTCIAGGKRRNITISQISHTAPPQTFLLNSRLSTDPSRRSTNRT